MRKKKDVELTKAEDKVSKSYIIF